MSFRKSAKNQKGERLGFKGGRSCDQYYQIDYIALKNLRLYDFSQKDLNYDQCILGCIMFFSFKIALHHWKVKKIIRIFCKSLFLENVSKSQQNDLKFHIRKPHFCL